MKFENKLEAEQAIKMAIGRIFRLGSRPFQEGDIQLYEAAKGVCLDAAEYLGLSSTVDYRLSFARDYHKMHRD